jgi:hypothetical protein
MKELKYIRLFEAFESQKLSKTLKFLNKEGKSNFLTKLKSIANSIDFPVSEFSDEYFQYLSFKKALDLNFSYEDNPCDAKSYQAFPDFGISGEVCDGGMIKRKWGNSISKTKCPICDGTGIEIRSDSSYQIKWIKFWFDKDGNYVGVTGTDGRIREQNKPKADPKFNYNVVKQLTHEEMLELPIGSIVRISIQGSPTIGVIWKSNKYNSTYIIQNSSMGAYDDSSNEWKKYGEYSWSVDDVSSYLGTPELLEPKNPKIEDKIEEVDPYIWNAPLEISWNGLRLIVEGNMDKLLSNAHFAIVLNFLDLKKSEFMKKSDIKSTRVKSKMGALALKNDDEIRKTNIARYIEEIKRRLDISPELSDMNKTLTRFMGGPYMGFYVLNGTNSSNLKSFLSRVHGFLSETDEGNKRHYYVLAVDDLKNITEKNLKTNGILNNSIKEIKKELLERDRADLIPTIDGILDLNDCINTKFKNMEFETLEDMEIAYEKISTIGKVFSGSDRLRIDGIRYAMQYLMNGHVSLAIRYLVDYSTEYPSKIEKLKKFIERL